MYEIGRVCYKIAGRDSNLVCVILSHVKKGKVLVDGQTRRREVNVLHLEPTQKMVKLDADATHAHVAKALEAIDIHVAKKGESHKTADRPKKVKVVHKKEEAKPAAKAKKATK